MRAFLRHVTLAAAALLAACGGGGVAPSPTGQPSRTSTPLQEVLTAPGAKIVFVREPSQDGPVTGQIWLATEDGTMAAAITPEGVKASYVGFRRSDGSATLYYVTQWADTRAGIGRTLWELDLTSGKPKRLLSFIGGVLWDPGASISPDARYVTYVDSGNLHLRDLDTGDDRVILQGSATCEFAEPGPCVSYQMAPLWSPDGKTLLVEKSYYEGSRPVIVDPFSAPPTELTPEGPARNPSEPVGPRAWSPDSRSFCGVNSYDGTGLFAASAPDWLLIDLVPEYQPSPQPSPPERYVRSCAWAGSSSILFVAIVDTRRSTQGPPQTPVPYQLEVSVHDLQAHRTNAIATIEWDESGIPLALALSPEKAVLARGAARPEVIGLRTGARTAILLEGDQPVAVISQ